MNILGAWLVFSFVFVFVITPLKQMHHDRKQRLNTARRLK